jgi:SAM-dependent methyltransferase
MKDLINHISKIMEAMPEKLVISKPKDREDNLKTTKIVLQRCGDYYQAEKFTGNQVFHENIGVQHVPEYITNLMPGRFYQLNAFSETLEFSLLISKSGSTKLISKKTQMNIKPREGHNREKSYIFSEGELIKPLIDMGVFTAEGKIINSMYDKYRQINRFVETVDDELSKQDIKELKVIDFGCGKGYLTFLLYYYLTEIRHIEAKVVGVDLKEEVMAKCNRTAEKYGYKNLSFACGDIQTYEPGFSPDMVISLHACDTATDYVLYNAVRWKAKYIFSMPCCQHELNGQIETAAYPILTRYGLLKENLSSIFTDAIRANLLAYSGYRVQVLDIVTPMNTPKNILIRAVKVNTDETTKRKALEEVKKLCEQFNLRPALAALLKLVI